MFVTLISLILTFDGRIQHFRFQDCITADTGIQAANHVRKAFLSPQNTEIFAALLFIEMLVEKSENALNLKYVTTGMHREFE